MTAREEYTSRRTHWETVEKTFHSRFVRLGNWRLTIAIIGGVLAWMAFGAALISPLTLLLPVSVFVAFLIWHYRVIRHRDLARRAIAFYERGLASIEDRWIESADTGERFANKQHVYAGDLDIFGEGSLFQMISRARTLSGERTLADWLLSAAPHEEAAARQHAIKELKPRLDLREHVALLGDDVRSNVDPDRVARWASAARVDFPLWLRPVGLVLAIAGVVTLLLGLLGLLPASPFLLVLACDFAVIYLARKQVNAISGLVDEPAQELNILSLLLGRLEREQFAAPRLQQIQSALVIEGLPASRCIKKLQRWMEWLDSSDHIVIRAIAPLLLWRQQCAFGIEMWRRKNGAHVCRWLSVSGEFEALCSLASLVTGSLKHEIFSNPPMFEEFLL
jgi:hypothetical protein